MRGCFVTGTDTGVGKTVVAAAIAAALHARGARVAAFKPVVTGLDEPEPGRPADHELLGAATGAAPAAVAPLRFGPAVSPHLAAELAGTAIEPAGLIAAAARAGAAAEALVAEGVGGLLVPITPEYTVRDLAVALGLPVVVAARPGLGTISHTLLTVEAARAAGLDVRAVVLTPWPDAPSVMQVSNRDTIARMAEVEVATLPFVGTAVDELAAAGTALPVDRWLGEADAGAVAPGTHARGAVAPGTLARGALAPGTLARGAVAPGTLARGALAPGTLAPDAVAPGTLARGALAPGAVAPDAVAPDALPPDAVAASAVAPGGPAPGGVLSGGAGPGRMPLAAPELRGTQVVLRAITAADVAPLAAMFATPEVARWWPDEDEETLRERVARGEPDTTSWAVWAGEEIVGLAQGWEETGPMYRHGGIDLSLHPGWHGRGLGSDTVRTIARWLFDERGHHRITIDPAAHNAVAIRCYERAGFRPVGVMRRYERGRDGTWHDGLLMDLLRDELR